MKAEVGAATNQGATKIVSKPPAARREAWHRVSQCSEEINPAHISLSTSGLQNCETTHFCCLCHLICGALLQQPSQGTISSFYNWCNSLTDNSAHLNQGDENPLVYLTKVTVKCIRWRMLIFFKKNGQWPRQPYKGTGENVFTLKLFITLSFQLLGGDHCTFWSCPQSLNEKLILESDFSLWLKWSLHVCLSYLLSRTTSKPFPLSQVKRDKQDYEPKLLGFQ